MAQLYFEGQVHTYQAWKRGVRDGVCVCVCWTRWYQKKSRLLKFYNVPATSAAFSKGIFAAASNSTNQANKAGGMRN